jgi:acyl-CoA thioesterase YciA
MGRPSGGARASPIAFNPEARAATLDAPAIRITAMPADTNPYGDIFGGWLMAHMDLAAGATAARCAKGRAVTIAVDGIVFHHPVKVGDEVSVYADVASTGRTSMTIAVQAWRRARHSDQRQMVTEANFTFVALDADGRPTVLPQVDRAASNSDADCEDCPPP